MTDNQTDKGPDTPTNTQQQQGSAQSRAPPNKLDIDKFRKANKNILYISAGIGLVLILIGFGYYLGLQTGTRAPKTSTTVQTSSIKPTTTISNISNQNTTTSTTTIAAPVNYNTTFIGICLPNGKQWSITLSNSIARDNWTENSTIDIITFSRPPGAYVYKAHINPSEGYQISSQSLSNYSGNVTIYPNSNGIVGLGTVTQLMFVRTSRLYNITFRQSGLAKGDRWGVTFNYTYSPCTNLNSVQTIFSSSASSISAKFQNGSLSYIIDPFAGYTATPGSGNFQIIANNTISISFR